MLSILSGVRSLARRCDLTPVEALSVLTLAALLAAAATGTPSTRGTGLPPNPRPAAAPPGAAPVLTAAVPWIPGPSR